MDEVDGTGPLSPLLLAASGPQRRATHMDGPGAPWRSERRGTMTPSMAGSATLYSASGIHAAAAAESVVSEDDARSADVDAVALRLPPLAFSDDDEDDDTDGAVGRDSPLARSLTFRGGVVLPAVNAGFVLDAAGNDADGGTVIDADAQELDGTSNPSSNFHHLSTRPSFATASEFRTPGIAELLSPMFTGAAHQAGGRRSASPRRVAVVGSPSQSYLGDGDTLTIRPSLPACVLEVEPSPGLPRPVSLESLPVDDTAAASPRPRRANVSLTTTSGAAGRPAAPGSPVLGAGRFGTVIGTTDGGRAVARKFIRTTDEGRSHTAGVELAFALRALDAPGAGDPWENIVEVYDAAHDPVQRSATLTMEYMRGGSVGQHRLFSARTILQPPFDAAVARRLAATRRVIRDVLAGLSTLHVRLRAIHRDLKPDNILLSSSDDDCRAKLADFGCVGLLAESERECHDQAGTTTYMSPERLKGQAHTAASDLWSVAVTALQMALGGFHPLVELHLAVPPDEEDARVLAQSHSADAVDPFWALAASIRFLDAAHVCQAACDGIVTRVCDALERALVTEEVAGADDPPALVAARGCVERLRRLALRCLRVHPCERPSALEARQLL